MCIHEHKKINLKKILSLIAHGDITHHSQNMRTRMFSEGSISRHSLKKYSLSSEKDRNTCIFTRPRSGLLMVQSYGQEIRAGRKEIRFIQGCVS